MAKINSKTSRCNEGQRHRLVELIRAKPALHTSRFAGWEGRAKAEKMWGQVARELNKWGPEKTWKQWKQVWRDIRGTVRARNSEIAEARASGNLPAPKPLTDFEMQVLRVLGIVNSDGIAGSSEFSFEQFVTSLDRSQDTSLSFGPPPVFYPSVDTLNDHEVTDELNRRTRSATQRSSLQQEPQGQESSNEVIAAGFRLLSDSIRYLADTIAVSTDSIVTAILSSRHPSSHADGHIDESL